MLFADYRPVNSPGPQGVVQRGLRLLHWYFELKMTKIITFIRTIISFGAYIYVNGVIRRYAYHNSEPDYRWPRIRRPTYISERLLSQRSETKGDTWKRALCTRRVAVIGICTCEKRPCCCVSWLRTMCSSRSSPWRPKDGFSAPWSPSSLFSGQSCTPMLLVSSLGFISSCPSVCLFKVLAAWEHSNSISCVLITSGSLLTCNLSSSCRISKRESRRACSRDDGGGRYRSAEGLRAVVAAAGPSSPVLSRSSCRRDKPVNWS